MTGVEVIELARALFGEIEPNSVTEGQARDYLSAALRELWVDLPASDLRGLIESNSLTLTSGKAPIDSSWERILEVYVDGIPALQVNREVIANTDFGTFFAPGVPIYHIDESNVFVRPDSASSAELFYLPPPPRVTSVNETDELDIAQGFQEAAAFLTASYMYAQEEDAAQAQLFRSEYTNRIMSVSQQAASE